MIIERHARPLPFRIGIRLFGNALSAGRSSVSSSSLRLLPMRRMSLALIAVTQSRIAMFNSASEKNLRLRSFASTKPWNPDRDLTFALSRGWIMRVGSTTQP